MDRSEVGDGDKNRITEENMSSHNFKVAAAECLNSWMHYLQNLNVVCAAGLRLSQSLVDISQGHNTPLAMQCHSGWEELLKATAIASNSVKGHIAAAMQELNFNDSVTSGNQRPQEHNQRIVLENLVNLINLHYQFSIAGCEAFGPMAICPGCQAQPGSTTHDPDCHLSAIQQCFANRSPSPIDETTGSGTAPSMGHNSTVFNSEDGERPVSSALAPRFGRSLFSLFPLPGSGGQRRWSEAAAAEVAAEGEAGTVRRWSMPWDHGRAQNDTGPTNWQQRYLPSKLITASQDRSQSTTPDATASNSFVIRPPHLEDLVSAVQLLSMRYPRQSVPQTVLPGHNAPVPFTGTWTETHEERMHRRMHPGPSNQRGNWQSVDVPNMNSIDPYEMLSMELCALSRKSSSSTDSSTALSNHSRTTNSSCEREGSQEPARVHTNLYSMWSGNEHLPFIKLPESQEPQDGDSDDPPTEKSVLYAI